MLGDEKRPGQVLRNPGWITTLFSNTEYAWIWLIVRVYIGWNWLHAGWGKLNSDAWVGGGTALKGFWERATVVPESGRPPVVYDWYRGFLQFMLDNEAYVWFAKLIAGGEALVGLGLLLGVFTGIAALFGAFMNWNFMLAGSASTNPIMGILGIGLLVAWKTAGWWGLDRWLLPLVGAPWQRGTLLGGTALTPDLTPEGGQQAGRAQAIGRWAVMTAGVVVAIVTLNSLDGWAQTVVLVLAGVLVALAGLGILPPGKRASGSGR